MSRRVTTPSTRTLPGNADIDGPRTDRDNPETCEYARLSISNARMKRNRWDAVIVDSRESAFTNKAQIQEWADDYGEDSDFFRVRVRGLPPAASDLQFIDSQAVFEAQQRVVETLPDDALVCGLDVARGGGDRSVFRFRRGADARSVPSIRISGEETRDSMRLVTKAAEVLNTLHGGAAVKMMFIDGTGIGGPIVDRLKQLGHTNVMEVQFGGQAPDRKYANMRSYMWGKIVTGWATGVSTPTRGWNRT